jgi:hypothetical protein
VSDKTFKITPMDLNVPGIHFNMFELSPEVIRAQRQAELENLAKYRAQKLESYTKWSDPVEGAKWRDEIAKEETVSREKLIEIPAELVAVRTGGAHFEIAPCLKFIEPTAKPSVWQRVKNFFARIFRSGHKKS